MVTPASSHAGCWTRPLMLRETHLGTSASKRFLSLSNTAVPFEHHRLAHRRFVPSPQPAIAAILGSLGYGSTLANGRWHTKGPAQIVYAGSSRALCQLEKRVHCNGANLANQALMRLELPARDRKSCMRQIWASQRTGMTTMAATQSIGMNWLASGEPGSLGAVICRARRNEPVDQPGPFPIRGHPVGRRAQPFRIRPSPVLTHCLGQQRQKPDGSWHGSFMP